MDAGPLWLSTVALSAFAATLSVLVLVYLRHCPLRALTVSSVWTRPGSRFLVDTIGPPRQGVIGAAGADKIANLFVDRDQAVIDRRVNSHETARATAQNAGIPSIVKATRSGARRLLVIEDGSNPLRPLLGLGEGLVGLLERRGVETDLALTSTTLDACSYVDGTPVSLMERVRDQQTVVILVMDERILRRSPLPVVQALFKSPAVIWMDPRLSKSAQVGRLMMGGLVLAPMTETALTKALEGINGLLSLTPTTLAPSDRAEAEDPYLHFADALPLALAASQLQPMSINLLDLIRRQHFRYLEPLDLLRIAETNGVSANGSSLRFAPALQRRLAQDFELRFEETEKKAIASKIMEALEQGRPRNRDSFAHAAWEAHFLQVQLGLDPEAAIAGLSRLARTSLGQGVRERLEAAGKIVPAGEVASTGASGKLQAALNTAQIGPLPLSSMTWGGLYLATGFLVMIPTAILIFGL